MNRKISKVRREFIAKIIADLGKTLFAIGSASYFFEKFPFCTKIALFIACVILI